VDFGSSPVLGEGQMNKHAYAVRMANAIKAISDRTGIDVSAAAMSKAPTTEILRLFQLEAVVEGMGPSIIQKAKTEKEIKDNLIAKLEDQKGIGDAMLFRIKKAME
jgi:hypothetical protein